MPWRIICPLSLGGHLDDVPNKSWDVCLKFKDGDSPSREQHLKNFADMCININIIMENVAVRLFIYSLEGEDFKWYHSLPNASITNWDNLMQNFKPRFLQEKIVVVLIKELATIKKIHEETIVEYVSKFQKVWSSIPYNIRETTEVQMEWFLEGLGPNLRYAVEDKLPSDLAATQRIAIAIEKRLLRVGLVTHLSFDMLEEEEANDPQTQDLLKRMEEEIMILKEQLYEKLNKKVVFLER